ncbi:MAG: ANTAR domain-containing protein [Candidatus Sedimenticola endophacoides]
MATRKTTPKDDTPPLLLVVEYDRLLSAELSASGFPVLRCRGPLQALQLGLQHRPRLALIDAEAPGANPTTLARRLWEELHIECLVAINGDTHPGAGQPCPPGTLGYLIKPPQQSQLRSLVTLALNYAAERRRHAETHTRLSGAIDRNREISVAVGICMERLQVEQEEAFEALRGYASANQQKLLELARTVIHAREDKQELVQRIARHYAR